MRRLFILLCLGSVVGCGSSGGSGGGDGMQTAAVSYQRNVSPIFVSKCVYCHFPGSPIGVQLFDPFDPDTGIINRPDSWVNARNPILVVPGKPEQSALIDKVKATDLDEATEGAPMPLNFGPLDASEVDAIRTWIADGANDDAFYQSNVAPIFGNGTSLGARAGKCSYCHSSISPNGPDVTNPFDSTQGLVGVAAVVGGVRVIPGDPDSSVLYKKIAGLQGAPALGSPMPYDIPPLAATEITTLEAWIANGAKDD